MARHEVPAGEWKRPPPPDKADPRLWVVVQGARGPVVLRRRETLATQRRYMPDRQLEQKPRSSFERFGHSDARFREGK